MTTGEESKGSRIAIDFDELRERSRCRKRYGRASLTINRWSGFGRLAGEGPLAEAISDYRTGKVTSEDLAWAFVRARIRSHSPTFSWEGAELERLIALVTECSEDPHFEAREPGALAAELVKAQDEETERLWKLAEDVGSSLRRSTESVSSLARLVTAPYLSQLAASQMRSLEVVKKALAPSLAATRLFAEPPALKAVRDLLRTSAVPTFELPPTLTASFGVQATALAIPKTDFLAARFRLPDSSYSQLTRTLDDITAHYRSTIPSSLVQQLAARQTLQVGDVIKAARSTAVQLERDGAITESRILETATAEIEEVADAPSIENLERMIERLGQELREGLADQEERRHRDRRTDWAYQLVLWFLAIYVSYYIALHFFLLGLKPGP
jgi:hypothetical protein